MRAPLTTARDGLMQEGLFHFINGGKLAPRNDFQSLNHF